MISQKDLTIDNIIPYLKDRSQSRFGFFSINYILINCKINELENFIKDYGIPIPKRNFITRLEYIKYVVLYLTEIYYTTDWQQKFDEPLDYCGYAIFNSKRFKKYIHHLDFVAKQELIETFADHCADNDITVYDTTKNSITPKMDMYLTTKKSGVKTGAVFVMNGVNINKNSYLETKKLIEKASKVSSWNLFVTLL